MTDLNRLLRPRSIAVIGGGAWCENVIRECQKIGFDGDLWAVHPKRAELGGIATVSSVDDLPAAPDAAYVGVNRQATIEVVDALGRLGAGGAVCFASGFAESGDAGLNTALLGAAGDMPILGPNCYGLVNYLDRVALWPDQHGGAAVERGVAIITQSSNIAINLTMQARGLPLAYMVTAGNQAQQNLAQIGRALLADDRVTALGLHIEGIRDLRALEALATDAEAAGKPVVALKVGASEAAQAAAISHTASLAGSDAGARALLARLGFARVESLPVFLETLKLAHLFGGLGGAGIASISCSGGEASIMADAAQVQGLTFPSLTGQQEAALGQHLGPLVTLSNPLDYHTFIWRDGTAMAQVFAAMTGGAIALTLLVLDFPRADRCDSSDWDIAVRAVVDAKEMSGRPMAVLASLPENLPEEIAQTFMAAGIAPLYGVDDGLAAVAALAARRPPAARPLCLASAPRDARVLPEAAGKRLLEQAGLEVPRGGQPESLAALPAVLENLEYPLVLKGEGLAHKTEAGAVRLNLKDPDAVMNAARDMPVGTWLVEEMVSDGVAELLVGVTRDPAHGFVLTLGAGGTMAEILQDTSSLLLPTTQGDILGALTSLRIAPVLHGYRGKQGALLDAIAQAVLAVQAFVMERAAAIEEVEINPLIVTPTRAVAADALIRMGEADD